MRLDRSQWTLVAFLFLLGLGCRLVVFWMPHVEGDERIYTALVEQLERGAGYTLQGHPILFEPWIEPGQYDTPMFYHPPGGPLFFLLFHAPFGEAGLSLAQVAAYALFFFGMLFLGLELAPRISRAHVVFLSGLAGFTPIMTHVATRHWLDGPQLAFATAGAACFVAAARREKSWLAVLAGLLLGYASLIKLTALGVIPAAVLLGCVVGCRNGFVWRSVLFVGVAGLVQVPWEIWQLSVTGSIFPTWAGKPSEELIAMNEYVRAVTIGRSPWVYVTMLPRVCWTVVPALFLLALQWSDRELRRRGVVLVLWAFVILGAHVWLGAQGYSKLLRYTVLVTPATVLLFSLSAAALWNRIQSGERSRLSEVGLALGLAGFALEIVQGLKTPLDNLDMIRSIL